MRKLTDQEWAIESEKAKRTDFDKRVRNRLGDSIFIPKDNPDKVKENTDDHTFDSWDDDNDLPQHIHVLIHLGIQHHR